LSSTITILLSTTPISSPTLPPPPTFFPDNHLLQCQTCQQMQPLVVNESNQLTK
jgi:hypothetical protein